MSPPVRALQADPAGRSFDVVIVGSGASGGWAAKRLTEAGLRVAVLEAGRQLTDADYKEHVPAYQLKYRGRTKRPLEHVRPRQSASYAVREWNADWFVNDIEEPYLDDSDPDFLWVRTRRRRRAHEHLGPPVPAPERHRLQGGVAGWRRRRLADWVRGHRAVLRPRRGLRRGLGDARGPAQLPDGRFLPPMGLTCSEVAVRTRLKIEVRPHDDTGTHGQSDASDPRAAAVPLLRAVRARMRHALVLQRVVHDDGRCRRDGPLHARHRGHGLQGARRPGNAPRARHPLHRSRHPSAARDLRARRRALRADDGVRAHPVQLGDASGSERASRTRADCWAST